MSSSTPIGNPVPSGDGVIPEARGGRRGRRTYSDLEKRCRELELSVHSRGAAVTELSERCRELEESIRAAFASYGLLTYHRESTGSWPRDRFESWLDCAAERAGMDIRGACEKPKEWWDEQLARAALKERDHE